MDNTRLETRVKALSPEKHLLFALRLGMTPKSPASSPGLLVGFAVTRNNTISPTLRQHLQNQLPKYMMPSQIVVLDDLPRTPNGKLDRTALKAIAFAAQQGHETSAAPLPPVDEIEAALIDNWSSLLGIDHISVHDSFFDLGGHSLLAVQMLAQVKTQFDREVPVSLIVETPTIANLATYLRSKKTKTTPDSITAIQPNGSGTPLYFLPVHVHGALPYRHFRRHGGEERPLFGFKGFTLPQNEGQLPTIEGLAASFVEDLLAFQPKPPYYLCGISVAGLIAFEMARQLRHRGVTEVEVLLLDTYGSDYPQRLSVVQAIRQHLAQLGTKDTSAQIPTRLADRAWSWFEEGYSAWKSLRAASPEADVAQEDVIDFSGDRVNRQLALMSSRYLTQAHTYDGDIYLYRAGVQPINAQHSETLGWEKLVRGEIHVHHVRGDHLGILRRRHVKQTAELVRRTLGQFDIKYRVNTF